MAHRAGITLSEAHLSKYIQDLLRFDGFRVFRMEPVSDRQRGRGFGERGMPDLLALRYLPGPGLADYLWIEVKRPGGKVKPHQRAWIDTERQLGGLIWVVGEDFEATPEGFRTHYKQSGLLRRPGLC